MLIHNENGTAADDKMRDVTLPPPPPPEMDGNRHKVSSVSMVRFARYLEKF